ncbi:ETX/MTX2 family pore-forming toxin [Nocardia brasiliensis]|uniref:ETX/MTX2 family pore-forming toxin n=1 Tax=Nocardia brasiliensis TaxID=37326 RepID=UPI00366E051B
MPQSIDLDKHFRDASYSIIGKDNPDATNIEVQELLLDELSFDGDINYHLDKLNPDTVMDTIDSVSEKNHTSVEQETTVTRHETITNSYTWSSEHSVSVGVSLSTTIKVPLVGGIDTTVSTEYSFTSSKSATETKERGWEFQKKITVPKHTKVTAVLQIEKTKPRIPYTMVGAFSGGVTIKGKVTFPDYETEVNYFRWPVFLFFEAKPLAGFHNEGTKTYFHTDGIFEASEGIRAIIDVIEEPLDNHESPRNYVIDVTPELAHAISETPAG